MARGEGVLSFYGLIFWVPALASALGLAFAWTSGTLRRPVVPLVWLVVALLLQVRGRTYGAAWVAGLTLQVVLAVYLQIKMKTA
jgi:hypothetical protein